MKYFISAMIGCMLLSGCVFNEYHETGIYELPEPAKKLNCPLHAEEFQNNSSSGTHLQIKQKNGRLQIDEYARWSVDPGALVSAGLNARFNASGEKQQKITGEINVFEGMEQPRGIDFVFSGSYRLNGAAPYRFRIAVPMQNNSAEETVKAAAKAIEMLSEQIFVRQNQTLVRTGK